MIIVIAGVSGTGKSTIGKLLSYRLCLPFFDADDFHPVSNIVKMREGIPLNDEDREPWLTNLACLIAKYEYKPGVILACSALKEAYRQILSAKGQLKITWIVLNGSKCILEQRLESRQPHFFDNRLLSSQLAALELPEYGLIIDIENNIDMVLKRATQYIKSTSCPL